MAAASALVGVSPIRASLAARVGLHATAPSSSIATPARSALAHVDRETVQVLDLRARQLGEADLLDLAATLPHCPRLHT